MPQLTKKKSIVWQHFVMNPEKKDVTQFKGLVSNSAVFVTILQFLSGVLVCKQYVVNKTTGEASVLPFLCGVLSASLWELYGIMKKDNKIIFVNLVGVVLMLIYMVVFYIYTFKKSTVLKQIIALTVLFLFIFAYVMSEENIHKRMVILGFLACSLTLITIIAPMSKLFYVLKVKNTECLPFPMIFMSFFVCLLWFIYGLIEDDPFIIMPNFIGGALAVAQLSLFVIYPRKPQSPVLTKTLIA